MKRIILDKGFVIDVDSTQYTLKSDLKEATSITDKGEEKTTESSKVHGYFSGLDSALLKFIEVRGKNALKESNTLKEVLEIRKQLRGEITELFSNEELKKQIMEGK